MLVHSLVSALRLLASSTYAPEAVLLDSEGRDTDLIIVLLTVLGPSHQCSCLCSWVIQAAKLPIPMNYSASRLSAGSTYAPEGVLLDDEGREVELPADAPGICALAQCCALCNDSSLYYAPGRRRLTGILVAVKSTVQDIGLMSTA